MCAIQCKFHDPANTIQKSDLDSFFTASGKAAFSSRLIVATAPLGKNALEALVDQQLPTAQIPIEQFEHSGIDWSDYSFDHPDSLAAPVQKSLRPHQLEALNAVQAGLEKTDRGKLIMACGTGKTFTSLRIAEAVAGRGGKVLFLVPSIALLSQTLREWSQERAMPLRAFAVCSDSKVGRVSEDFTVADLAYPATTNTQQLLKEVTKADEPEGLTVFFSTYQSIDVVAKAQAEGLADFDLVICDEAHRTAGFSREGADESAFLHVHSDDAIKTAARVYMTATPKIYAESAKNQADENATVIYSMDNESVFGPIFHRLGSVKQWSEGLTRVRRRSGLVNALIRVLHKRRHVRSAAQHIAKGDRGRIRVLHSAPDSDCLVTGEFSRPEQVVAGSVKDQEERHFEIPGPKGGKRLCSLVERVNDSRLHLDAALVRS